MKPYAYYNEWDDYAAQWLRNLINAGHIAPGDVDTRSITDVTPDDLRGYTQLHFFAGIGGWSRALRLAGWPDDKPACSFSLPCQPFSTAGKQLGVLDERHLAPHFLSLVAAVRPPVLFGEQVAAAVSKDNWLDDLLDALEREGYATGAATLGACGLGAPHIRQRLWFVAERLADSRGAAGKRNPGSVLRAEAQERGEDREKHGDMLDGHRDSGADGRLANPLHAGRPERRSESGGGQASGCGEFGGVDNPTSPRHDGTEPGAEGEARDEARLCLPGEGCGHRRVAEPNRDGCGSGDCLRPDGQKHDAEHGGGAVELDHGERPSETHGFWDSPDWLFCRDGKWRPTQSGLEPLAHGVSNRVGRLRAYGNAIVPQAAAEIIRAYMARDRLRRAMTLDFDEM